MGIENRPYVGTWQLSGMSIVQHSPDALVYINGDVSIPGCYKCNSYIDVQKYITNVSVDASNDPSGASANISMSIPRHSPDSFSRDADHILRPGLEVTIYMRGYFPVKGQFKDVPAEETGGVDISEMISYPYYHVFHGVTTQVDFGYSGGFREATISCNSMLYFWQYHNISENGAAFGTRPTNTNLGYSLVGNRFNGWTPYSIIYTMYSDIVGAAGSVAYVLRDKTNVAARDYRGRSLYSLTIDYWNERFKQKMINLRMHGASGEVLSTAQAIFLSRLSGKQVKSVIDAQYGGTGGGGHDLLSAARSLGLIKRVKDPVTGEERDYNPVTIVDAIKPPGEGDESVKGLELNFADHQAFVQDVGQYGGAAIFETTYESKLDIINKVLEVTGWEFYQDVDGDFVFKPPMYNLDTKGSQVYVIRAVDIISINQVEKEPECTYVTTTSNHFKNITGTGTEGEFGVRGQYMDYKLIAQYGWRPFSFESNYFTDKESLFYNAMNRLDVQNAGINSASLTIPIRPELRPGYPIYIEPYDCYYYIQGLSHNMSYGSQCTTTLTLTAKRKKFYAPGKPEDTGISSIDMKITTLPPKPLEVLDGNGNPRLAGFPNVVMALDPEAINPVYFAAGFDLENISDPNVLNNILRYASADAGVISKGEGNTYIIPFSGNDKADLYPLNGIDDQPYGNVYTFDQLLGGAGEYYNSVTPSEEMTKLSKEIEKLTEKYNTAVAKHYDAANAEGTGPSGNIAASIDNEPEVKKITTELNGKKEKLKGLINGQEKKVSDNPDAMIIKELIKRVENYGGTRTPTEDFPNPSKTANTLAILSEKKSMFSNNAPGHYRYYSCSSPFPEHQGPLTINGSSPNGGSTGNAEKIQSFKEGFLVTPTKVGENGYIPEAEIGQIEVTNGFRVTRRTNMNEVVPTDFIQTMTFARHEFSSTLYSSNNKSGVVFLGLGDPYKEKLDKMMQYTKEGESDIVNTSSLKDLWDKVTNFDGGPSFPDEVGGIKTSEPFSTFRDSYFPEYIPKDGSENYMKDTYDRIKRNLIGVLFMEVNGYLYEMYGKLTTEVSQETIDKKTKKSLEKAFQDLVSKASLRKANQPTKSKKKEEKTEQKPFYSPVFPVSDAGGYTVVGSYRYGRGLQVYAHSSMEELAKIDPFKYADPQSIESYLLSLQGKEALNTTGNTAAVGTNIHEANLIESIKSNQNAPESIKKEIDGYSNSDLSNWMARIGEGVNKVPVSNAAVFLSSITPNKNICTCRGAHADVHTDAFATDKFLSVIPSDLDELSKFQSSLAVQQSLKWTRIKNALAGDSPDAKRGNVYEMSKSLKSAYNSLFNSTGDAISSLTDSARERIRANDRSLENNIDTIAENLRSLGEGTATISSSGSGFVTQQNENESIVTDPIARAAMRSGRDAEEARLGNPKSVNTEEWNNISSSDEGDE